MLRVGLPVVWPIQGALKDTSFYISAPTDSPKVDIGFDPDKPIVGANISAWYQNWLLQLISFLVYEDRHYKNFIFPPPLKFFESFR